jgi:hypothetical protein
MIPNHNQFLTAIQDKKKVCVRFYSLPDSGVLDRVCAPLDYGPGDNPDGLNRYWLWDSTNESSVPKIGLLPQQIVDLAVLGESFDPAQCVVTPTTGAITPGGEVADVAPERKAGPPDEVNPPIL